MGDVPVLAERPESVAADAWAAACAAVRAFCDWHVAPSFTEMIVVDGPGGSVLALPTLHLTDLTLEVDGREVNDPQWSTNGLVVGHWWSRKPRSIEATLTHGFSECPAEVLEVVRSIARRITANPSGAVRVAAGPFNFTASQTGFNQVTPSTPLDAEKTILGRYRLPPLT